MAATNVRTNGAVPAYLEKLLHHSLLDREEELALARRARRGDRQAEESLIRHNLRFVLSLAKRYAGRGIEIEDLFNEGVIGLQRAIRKFDPDRGLRLSTYAIWWIRQAITRYLADQSRTIRVPVNAQRNLPDEAAENDPEDTFTKADLRKLSTVSLDQKVFFGSGHDTIECTLADALSDDRENAPSPETAMERTELADLIAEALTQLTPRERDVIKMRFVSDLTLEQIAAIYGVTRERVRQIEAKALVKLRRALEAKDGGFNYYGP